MIPLTHIYAGSDHFANHAIHSHGSLGFRPYAIIPKESILTPTFNPMMNVGDPQIDVEQETIHYCGRSIAPTKGQGISDYVDTPLEQYDGIVHMIHAGLAKGQHTDPDKSVLTRASVKLDYPETYAGGSDLEEFEVFVAGILRWLKMN